MLKKFLFVILCFTIISCQEKSEKDFQTFATNFVKAYAELFPDETPLSKNNEKLAYLALPTATYFDSVKLFHQRFSSELKRFNTKSLDFPYSRDVQKVENILKNVGDYLSEHEHNPLFFNVLPGFKRILESNYAADVLRLQTLFDKLDQVPAFYDAAKNQLSKADRPLADAAVEQQIQTYLFFDETLTDFLNKKQLMTPQYLARIDEAKLAVKDYVAFVESFRVKTDTDSEKEFENENERE